MFRTELDRTKLDCTELARTELARSELARSELACSELARSELACSELDGTVAEPGPAARGGRVISAHGPQPPHFGDEPPIYDDGVLRITRIPGPGPAPGPCYALAGEIDESIFRVLTERLAELVADLDEVHLDLADLVYSDLAGLRAIVLLAAAGRRRVVLHRVPPHLRVILGIVGWDSALGVELAG